MGISNNDPPTSAVITFSCSAKILKGDRFIGALEEKAQRYRRQIETLYEKSALGPALFSVTVDRFGKDGLTIHFRLAFNRRKLIEDLTNIEKAIKDIFLSDTYSKKPIFRNVKFDPRSVNVRQQVQKNTNLHSTESQTLSTVHSQQNQKNSVKSNKMGVVLKSLKNGTSFPQVATAKPIIRDEPEFNEEDLPVIQGSFGSFKISKTEADITEKKTENHNTKAKQVKSTAAPNRKTTYKESSVTSAVFKMPGGKSKISKLDSTSNTTPTTISVTTPLTSPKTKQRVYPTTTTSTSTTSGSASIAFSSTRGTTSIPISSTTSKFKGSPQIMDDEPWIPILPNIPGYSKEAVADSVPTYTSFTNPGLSFNFQNSERLGSTSIKSHPIPVNKIPFTKPFEEYTNTEPTRKHIYITEMTTNVMKTNNNEDAGFIKMGTLQHKPGSQIDDFTIRNISSIFYNLASSLENTNISEDESDKMKPQLEYIPEIIEEEEPVGQGHVEVVEVDAEELLAQTTKIPLVTLLPVRSNSGIVRPFKRNRFAETNNLSVENRSFPSHSTSQNLDSIEKSKNKSHAVPNPVNISTMDNYQIMGVLNFAQEFNEPNSNNHQDIVRFPKMDKDKSLTDAQTNISFSTATSSSAPFKGSNLLSPEQIRQLAEISRINDNETIFEDQPLISTKAISSSYSVNQNGFKILTKPFSKPFHSFTKNSTSSMNGFNLFHKEGDCQKSGFKCADATCLPESTKCNQLIDCKDGSDEEHCNCADFLKSQLLVSKICDGVVDCWDFSDENQCDWCSPEKYVCSNSRVCIAEENICDGLKDCPQGDDERQCVTIAADAKTANEFPYYSKGFLMVRKRGVWGKLCVDNFENVVSKSHISWEIADLGKAICKSMTYHKMEKIESIEETEKKQFEKFFELTYSAENKSKSNLSFKESECPSKKVVKVTCQSLECGARPQAVKHIARVVGGGNAELGAWPWQVALYKEGEFQCGATLLSGRWLVSAGHCFYRSRNEHWVARLGALRRGITFPSPYEQLRTISRIIIHPNYLDFGFVNDISLLKMDEPVVFSDYVRPVCLPQSTDVLDDGHLCTVIGWGQLFEVGRIFPDTLQEVQIPVISTAECRKRTLFLPLYKITDDMFCAGYDRGGRDACLGDSGGPLMCSEPNGRWTLHGITSNGYGCARANRPGVYTKVANYVDWINSYIDGDDSQLENVTKIITSCSGHRCPLGECLPESRLCNGYIECSDGSDEKNCIKS